MKIKIGENIIKLTPVNAGIIEATITDNDTTNTIELPNEGQAKAGETIEAIINITANTTAINVTFPTPSTEVEVEIIKNGEGDVVIDPKE